MEVEGERENENTDPRWGGKKKETGPPGNLPRSPLQCRLRLRSSRNAVEFQVELLF